MAFTVHLHTHHFSVKTSGTEVPQEITVSGFEHLRILRIPAGEVGIIHDLTNPEFYRHGWNSWSPTAWRAVSKTPWRIWNNPARSRTAEDPITDSTTLHRSYQVGALTIDRENVLLLGSLSLGGALIDADLNELRGHQPSDQPPFSIPGGSCCQGTPWLLVIGPERQAFAAFGTALAEELHVAPRSLQKEPGRKPVPVWSSWYSWFEEVTQDIVAAEISDASDRGFGVMEVDDGWEQQIGRWEPNSKFPDIADLASQIQAAGMRAGLWVAPFIVRADSDFAAEHPDWLVHQADSDQPADAGENWGTTLFAVDTTHPGASEWIQDTMARARQWGFTYFKADFIYAAAIPGRRFADVPRELAYRRGLELVRGAIGEDAYLLGSGALPAASLGILDGMRAGPDTAPYWDNTERHRDPSGPGVLNALRSSLSRVWWRPWIDVDPDVALVRSRGSLLPPEVSRLTLDAAFACGVLGCSDPGSWLSEGEKVLLYDAIQAFGDPMLRVTQVGRYAFVINGRLVDFDPWINMTGRVSDRLIVK